MRVGVISVSDNRKSVHEGLLPYIMECEEKLCKILTDLHCQCIRFETVNSGKKASAAGSYMLAEKADAVVFNISMFSFPNLTTLAARVYGRPVMLVDFSNPALPGLVGLKANEGMLRIVGIPFASAWGTPDDPVLIRKIEAFCHAAYAIHKLNGSVFGLIGGRSIGIGTAAVNPDLYMTLFGIDVEHIDELELVRRTSLIPDELTDAPIHWLKKHTKGILFDNDKLTEESLKDQVKYYLATKDIIDEFGLDFGGIKCHYEMSAHYSTQCLSVALFNDLCDWDGPKDSFAYSCESDCDGALSMQILKLMTGFPSFLADTRFIDDDGMLTFCNCGAMPPWYAGRHEQPDLNFDEVTLTPIIPKYHGMGCHVQYIASPGEITFARFSRTGDQYICKAFVGDSVEVDPELIKRTAPTWPHIFVRTANPRAVMEKWPANHVHGTPGNRILELQQFCSLMGIDFEEIK